MSKDTVAIVFSGGAYGTYLEWCLTTLVNNNGISEPFTENGNSHKFVGNQANMVEWRDYVVGKEQHKFVRVHPKQFSNDCIRDSLCEIANDTTHVIYLYPSQQDVLLTVNNYFYKIYNSWFEYSFSKHINPDKIYLNWPIEPNTPADQIPDWIKREFLSFYLMPAWFDQVDWGQPLDHNCQTLLGITVHDLLFDFVDTLLKIEKFCNLKYQILPQDLLPAHAKNLKLQRYLDHDRVCNAVVDSIKNNSNINWDTLSLPSEAWIQWSLRNIGYEIKCHGLDVFPTNSDSLRDILYVSNKS